MPKTDVTAELANTALVGTDPQIDFLSPQGVTWKVVGKSVEHHGTVANIGRLFKTAKDVGMTVAISPHKVFGPEANDLNLQLRNAGMSANLCVQAHMHELLETGHEVAIVRDATAAAMLPEGDGYQAALINFRYMANALWTTDQAVDRIMAVKPDRVRTHMTWT